MKKFISFFSVLLMYVAVLGFTSCGDDDSGNEDSGSGGGGGSSVSVVGKSYKTVSTDIVEDADEFLESVDNTQVTFTSATQCKIRSWGYDYIWYNGYRKEYYDETYTASCYINGNKITVKDWPLYYYGGDMVFTVIGNQLLSSDDYVYDLVK